MIKSDRKFGVEIEFTTSTASKMTAIRRRLNVVDDGSLRPLPFAGEYVSGVLSGEEGEKEIHNVCEVLKKYGGNCDNPKTSMHIHLDGRRLQGTLISSKRRPTHNIRTYAISNRLRKELGMLNIKHLVNDETYNMRTTAEFCHTRIDSITYISKAPITKHPLINYTYYWLEKPDRFKWLRNTFYFYTLFSDVMEGIVSNSRRFGNMYCIPLGSSYSLDEIANTKTEADINKRKYKQI